MRAHDLKAAALALAAALATAPAHAWGPDGHNTVGAIADQLLAGTPVGRKAKSVLGGMSLRDAAVWADCARGVDAGNDFEYTGKGEHRECAVHETPAGIAAMADYVRRNNRHCTLEPHERTCHTQYHFADVAPQRDRYAKGLAGTSDHDIVAVVDAAIEVLQGHHAPAPFDIRTQREALLLLAHFVGDIHQPLHVGSVYLDASGRRVDPDAGPLDPATATHGGNSIVKVDARSLDGFDNMHHTWDAIPAALLSGHVDEAWLARARKVPATPGPIGGWAANWATGSLLKARDAFAKLKFGPKNDGEWSATLPVNYNVEMTAVKQQQLTLAGARLAQVLRAVWN
jgi:hypothetical protein